MNGLYKQFFLRADILIMILLFINGTSTVIRQKLNLFRLMFIILGIMIFALSEYITHRFLFHLKAPKNPILLKLLKRLHYDHHTYPEDLKLLFLPLWYSLPNFFILSAIFYFYNDDLINTISFGIG